MAVPYFFSEALARAYIADPACVVFAFDGHGHPNGIIIDDANDIVLWHSYSGGEPFPPLVPLSHPGCKLAYLWSCYGAAIEDGAGWNRLFRSECVVGWTGEIKDNTNFDIFDREFWKYIRNGYKASDAVTAAHKAMPLKPDYTFPRFNGDTRLGPEFCINEPEP